MIGENIKKIREYKNIGVNELARLAEVNSSYLSAIERGEKKNPSTKMINKIAEALGVPSKLLLSDKETIDSISNELLKISDFSTISELTTYEERKETVQNILLDDPSIFYELDEELQNKFTNNSSIVNESVSSYETVNLELPKEAQEELNNFMEYLKHKYNIKE